MIVTIVMPTLNFESAVKTLAQAEKTAGLPCATVLVKDYDRRGSTVCGNAAFRGGIELRTPFVAYINDDTWITQENWLERLVKALETNPTYGVAVPGGGCRTSPQNTGQPGMPRGIEEIEEAAFICAVFRRDVLTTVGIFDYNFTHYGNDSDLFRRMRRVGWRGIWVKDVFVEHVTRKIAKRWQAKDKKVFKERWS